MSKAVAVATVYFVLVIILYQVINDDDRNFHSIRAARRLGYNNISPPHFDPLMEIIERSFDKNTDENLQNDSRYLDDDGRLNTTFRIMVLFPFLDTAPKDGFIDYKEMEFWIIHQAINRLNFRTKQALELHDTNEDGLISFSEYLPRISNQDIERDKKGHREAGWWYERFKNADADLNGLLNFNELKDFLYPEDSTNVRIQEWLLKENIRQMDYDNDQKLDLMEFETGAYDSYKNYVAHETEGDEAVSPKEDVFAKLDLNQDKLLEMEELKPFLQYLSPGEMQQAKHYTRFLINEADENGDGKLTIHEMINNDYIFYNTVYHHHTEASDDDENHDEL